ncbi:hypothetical protein L6164_035262 [Bauhinia variegata]|uniref:Uncharacterized protein n=1 Tax=Bauhinia variegata TaxID=167791 RepID=A0ACB9KXM0_BAUVA|nr:hypothetical protein L6164_035262 [Bauhinia variegata]
MQLTDSTHLDFMFEIHCQPLASHNIGFKRSLIHNLKSQESELWKMEAPEAEMASSTVCCNEATLFHEANESVVAVAKPMMPANVMEVGKMEMIMMMNESRRKLGSFQICALCTCCGGAKGVCLPSPCCYAINCNIPNRPFGFCSVTPKTCNCFGCHL